MVEISLEKFFQKVAEEALMSKTEEGKEEEEEESDGSQLLTSDQVLFLLRCVFETSFHLDRWTKMEISC